MAIDFQKSLDNVRKQMGTYKPTAADVGKIDLNKSLQNVRALQKQQQEMLEQQKLKTRKLQTSPLSARAAETLAGLQEGGTQKQQTLGKVLARPAPSYPRLSIGERVGQTLAGLQEGIASSVTGFAGATFPVIGEGLARTATNADQYGRGVIQNKIDTLRQKGMQTDENGLGYFDTPEGEAELNAGLRELQSALRVLTGQDVTISGLAAAQDVLDSTPTINWGRWAQVDTNAGQAMQAIEDRKDTEARSAYEDYYNDWLHLMEREDFTEKSRYRSTATGEEYKPGTAMFGGSGFGDLMYDYINKNQAAVERQQLLDTTAGFSALGLDQSFLQTMNDTEVGIYNYLYATEGRDRANEYLQYIQNSLTARQRQQTQDWFRQYAQENPVKASAFSVLQAPASGLAYLGQTADLLRDGKIDQNAAYNKFADIPSTIRETVSQNWGPTGSFLYQTGMSMADFLLTLGISGGSNLSLAIMGSGAAADTVIDAKDRGLSDAQAFTLGTVAGVAEALTERVSIESLLDMTTLGKSAVGYIVKNALAEAGEEASSGIINLLTDIIVSRDKSQWQQEIDRYFAQGMTKKQAVNLALMNQAKSIGLDALGGALSGGLLAGGGAITNRVGEVQRQQDQLQSGLRLYGTMQELREAAETPSQSQATPVQALPGGEPRVDAVNEQRVDISPAVNQQGFEQAQNMPVQNNAQAVDVIQGENQQANQGFAQETQRTQQTPVQSNAQAQTENVDIMETPVKTQEPEKIREARALIAQYEANGGTLNGQQERSLPAADGQGWQPDQSAGEQAGGMEGGTIELESYANQGAVARSRQNRLRNLEAGRTNPEWLNLDKSRYDIRRIQTFPEEAWDGQMRRAAQRAFEKGVDVQYFAGTLRVGGTRVDGVNLGDGRILIQADNQQWSVDQLTDHELMHTYLADEYGMRDEMIKKLETQDLEGLNQMVLNYVRQYQGVIDLRGAVTDEEVMQRSFAYVIDEIICDAYAGMNRRGWGATKFSETVRTTYENRLNGRDAATSQDVRGPPRYSVAEDFESKCEQIENGTLDRSENPFIYVSATTPEILIKKAGAQNLPIIISYESLYLAVRNEGNLTGHYHNLGADAAAKIVEGLADPDEIIGLQNGRINAVVQFEDESGRTAMVSVELAAVKDFQGKNSAYNLILTMFEPRGRYLDNVRSREGNKVVYKKENQAETSQVNPRLNELSGTVNEEPTGSGPSVPQGASVVKARFSLSDPVEQTETLIALHNMTEEKLRRTIELGAWPAPSIAIVQAEQGHTNFGDYSAVFPRSTIDPEADSRNRVYGSDAWTPTHNNALIESEVNYEARRAFDGMIYDLSSKFAGGVFAHSSQLGGILSGESTTKTLDDIARSLAKNEAIQAAYLQERGETLEPVYKEKVYDSYGNAALSGYINSIGYQELARLDMELTLGNRLSTSDLERAKDAMIDAWVATNENRLNQKPELRDKRIEVARNRLDDYRVERFIKNAWEYYENYGESSGEIDRSATAQKMFDRILPDGRWDEVEQVVQDWVRPKLEGVLGESGIYNGRDRITNSGRRSFKQTHYPVTAENIVRAMYEQGSDRGEGLYGANAEGLASVASPEYRSVDEMHTDEDRLRTEDEEVYQTLMREINADIQDFTERTMEATEAHASSSYEERNIIEYVLVQAAGQKTVKGVQRVFRKEGYNLPAELAQAALDLYNKAATAPTKYFEAKPERVVSFDEALAIVMPDSAPPDIISQMQVRGVEVLTYETDNEQDRMRVLNGIQGARFSVSDETDDDVQMLETAEENAQPEPERKRKRDAHTARKELRTDLMNLFSVPVSLRGEAGRAIDNYAQQIIERGSLNNYDRDALFDILHNYGEMTVPAGEYEQTLRGAVKGAKVYVPDGIKAEFGEAEDWNEFKREAFAAGVYFTSNPKDPAADEWNQELSEMFPGAFDENETDAAWILRQIVNVAEEGKSEKMTLAEYAASLAEQYGPEVIDDYYANMERQMDQLLNSFADKARFENNLRERTENQLRRDADYRREQRERQRQTRHLRELQQKTLKQLQWLSKNRNKAPADLRKQFEEVLSDIDVFAVSAANEMNYSNKYGATWRDLKEMYLEARKNDPNWLPSKDLDRIVSRLTDPKLEDFNYNELNDLYRAALGLRQELYNRRNLLNDNRMFEEVYDSSVKEISEATAGYKGTKRDRLMNLQQLTPMNVIERMADWNPNSAWLSMGKQLEQGERDTKKFAIQSNKLLQEFIENNQEWLETADGQGKDAIWYEYELPELTGFRRGDAPIFSDKRIKVYMTPAMKIQLFLESKSYDNLNHMLGGRRFADKDMYTAAKGDAQKRREAMAQGQIVRLTPEMVRDMVKDLTPQELELANILGNGYYNGFAKQEINRVSNILYGYDKAMSSWYTPIFTDQSFNKTEPGIYDATAEGAGNLKERVRMSTNPSLNLSAFDAFERSVSQTSKFVGMAIPVRNWNTLMNWRSKDDSMKNAIATKWGAEMQNYLDDVVVRLQNPNVEEKTVLDEVISGALSNYISAVFGLNPSVVAKQFGSFYMAIPYLGLENMPNPKQIHNVDPEIIAKYSPELDDRLMGYAIQEVSQLKEKPNWSQRNKAVEFVAGGGAITAMDGWTAKTLWPWAENKVAKETGLQRGTDEFYRRVAVEFDNAIVRSQSINDVMHRSKLMNSKNAFTRAFTMFKTDSAQSYNILREAFGEMQYAKKHGSEAQKKAANKKAAYAVLGIAANNLWAAAITALINLWKAKGKNYRDEEGNLTLPSIAAQYTEDVLTSMAGIVIGGEEIADVIASLLGGDKFYGIEIAGGEQLSDIVDEIVAAGTGAKEILADGYYILNNGGDLGEYLEDRGSDLIGAAKEMAQKLAKYIAGLPVDNLEAYLVGTLRWAAPQAVAAYEDALKTPDKAGLKGLKGEALNVRMGNVLNDRMGGASDATVEELARLYAADLTDVVPPAEAEKIGEETLTADEQQAYRISLHNTLGMHLDEFVASERYQGMDDEAREQSLKWLYSYAKEIAKSGITGEDPETNVQRINELLDNGMAISEALAAYDEFTRANKLLEAGLEPELSADVAQAIHDKEDENGPDVDLDNLERYEIMLDAIGNEITRYAAMAGLMPEKERARFQAGHDWVDSETYVGFLREWKTQYPEDLKSQDKVKKLLKEMDLDNDERAALWQMCNKSWKWEKNPFDRSIGKEIAAQIEASYAEIDGE